MNQLKQRIVKSLGVFGGVQTAGVICSVLRAKLVSVWLGAAGVGLFGIFNTAIEMVATLTQLDIKRSAIRELSQSAGNQQKRDGIIASILRISWILGIAGAVLMLIFAPVLSFLSFGDTQATIPFRILAIAVFLSSVQNGWLCITQGTGYLNSFAKAQLCGILAGFTLSVPLFYWLRMDSIVPSILAYSASTALFAWLYTPKRATFFKQTLKESFSIGKNFIVLGLYMTLSSFVTLAASFIFMSWLNKNASASEAGYFNAGFTLVNRYAGIILAGIAAEYYPRLASIANDKKKVSNHCSAEIDIILRVLLPIALLFVSLSTPIVTLLYSPEFNVTAQFVAIASIGAVLRGVSWCIAFIILARGDGKIYLLSETLSAIAYVGLNILFYNSAGIAGLGISYCIWYLVYTATVYLITIYRYDIRFDKKIGIRTILTVFAVTIATILLFKYGIWISLAWSLTTGCLSIVKLTKSLK